jgi:hypothetical protein
VVDRIADDGVPGVLEVHPDLVGASGVQREPHQVADVEPCNDLDVGSRRTPVAPNSHALAVRVVAADRGLDGRAGLVEVSPRKRRVRAPDGARGHRRRELPMCLIGARDQHEPRGIAIEAVHDAGPPGRPATARGAARGERVHQRVIPVARGGMHHETRRLVDHEQVFVLEHHTQRDVVRGDRPGWSLVGNLDLDRFASHQRA